MQKTRIIWKKHKTTLVPLLITALLLRLAMFTSTLPYIDELNDQKAFEIVTEYFVSDKNFYAEDLHETTFRTQLIRNYPYGPMPSWLFAALDGIGIGLAIPLRLFLIAIDVLFTFLLFVTAIRLGHDAKLISWIYAFNPLTIIITAYHGQLDTLTISLAFSAAYILMFHEKKHAIAGFLFGLSMTMKMFTILLWPWFITQMKTWKERITFTVLAIFSFAFPLLTILTTENASRVIKQTISYGGAGTENGILLTLRTADLEWATTAYHSVGKYILVLTIIIAIILFRKRLASMDGAALTFIFALALAPTVGMQYFTWFLPFYLLSRTFRLRAFLIQLGLLTLTMGLFYGYHAAGINALTAIGITADMRTMLYQMFTMTLWTVWVGFIWMMITIIKDAIPQKTNEKLHTLP